MNYFNMFNNFYSNLSSDGLFFFWIIVFLFCFLVFLLIMLVIKNRRLTRYLIEEYDHKIENDNIEIDNNKDDIIIKDSTEIVEDKNIETQNIQEDNEINKEETEQQDNKIDTGLYKKNILREINARMQTSPINIERFDIDDSVISLEEDNLSDLDLLEDNYEINDSMKIASDIVTKMEEEIKPSNIELTDYEKKQEEEAIISYEELLKVKDKIYNITDDEENEEFLDELKNFRLDLQ